MLHPEQMCRTQAHRCIVQIVHGDFFYDTAAKANSAWLEAIAAGDGTGLEEAGRPGMSFSKH
jgi:hypothetical protein